MGWKTVKERYNIGHIVHIREGKLCIGSPYCPAIIEVGMDGQIKKPYESYGANPDLKRYMDEFAADPQALSEAIAAEDTFERSLPTYTYDEEKGAVEKFCEERGWPNITHDGELMYENTFFKTKDEARQYGIKDQEAGIRLANDRIKELNRQLAEAEVWRAQAEARLARLKAKP